MRLPKRVFLGSACFLAFALAAGAQDKSVTLEEVVARVNNDVITRSDLDRAAAELREEVRQGCSGCTAEQVEQKYNDQQKDLLRDLIDNSLLAQRAKDDGINVDTELVKRLDEIRIQNNIASMEDLEQKITASGQDFEDFKNNIRNQLLQQELIRREVGSKIILDHAQVQQYYDAHKSDFVKPELVSLREIFVSTAGKSEAETADLRKKADNLLQRVKAGDDFGELAKRFSDGNTAKQGGDLGTFERGQLAPEVADVVFKLQRNDTTGVLPTKDGFLLLQVTQHYEAGLQPEPKVEDEIMNKLYTEQMGPTLRTYLATLRQDSFVQVKAGYVDTASTGENSIDEATPSAANDPPAEKKAGHKFLFLGKKSNPPPNGNAPAAPANNGAPNNNANNTNSSNGA